jgi:hypothetical protein
VEQQPLLLLHHRGMVWSSSIRCCYCFIMARCGAAASVAATASSLWHGVEQQPLLLPLHRRRGMV